jgi:hypothetical protein
MKTPPPISTSPTLRWHNFMNPPNPEALNFQNRGGKREKEKTSKSEREKKEKAPHPKVKHRKRKIVKK